jgi:hypothetical protein
MSRRFGNKARAHDDDDMSVAIGADTGRNHRRTKLVLAAVGCVALGFAAQPVAANAAALIQVFITNDDAHPVPVKGTVSVGNTVPVNGTVNVGNTVPVTGTVTVANQATPPAVVGEPLSLTRTFQVSDSSCTSVLDGAQDLYTVPAGKRLILDHVSVSAQVLDNGYSRVWLSDGSARYFIPITPPQFDVGSSGVGFGYATGTDSPNAVVGSGGTVSIHMVQTWRNGSNNLCSVTHYVTITGRLVS